MTDTPNGASPVEQPAVKVVEPVDLDLDALERDGNRPGPYSFRIEGVRFTLTDPRELDWQDLLVAQRNPLMFIKFTMGPEQYKTFLATHVPEWKMERLMIAFFKHFGMADSPEARALLA